MDEIQRPFATDPFPYADQVPGARLGTAVRPTNPLNNMHLMRPIGKALIISCPLLALLGAGGFTRLLNFKQRTNLMLLGSAIVTGFGGAYYTRKVYWSDPRFCQAEEDQAIQRIFDDNTLLDRLDQEFGSLRERGYLTTERITAAMVGSLPSPVPSILDREYPSLYELSNDAQRTWIRNNILNPIAQEENLSDAGEQYEHLRGALAAEANRSDWLKQADLTLLQTCLDARSTSHDYISFRREHPQPLNELLEAIPALRDKLISNGWLWSLTYKQATEHREDLEQLGITQAQLDWAERTLQSEVTTQLDQWKQDNPTHSNNEARRTAIDVELASLRVEAQGIAIEITKCERRMEEIQRHPSSEGEYQALVNLYDDLDKLTSDPPSDPEDDQLIEIRYQLQTNNFYTREWLQRIERQPRNLQVPALKQAIPNVEATKQKWEREYPTEYAEWKKLDTEFYELNEDIGNLEEQSRENSKIISKLEKERRSLYEQTEEGMKQQFVADARARFGEFLKLALIAASF